MADELFKIPETKSPRLKWLEKKNVHTHRNTNVSVGDEDEFSGEPISPWCAYVGKPNFPRPDAGYGDTEHDAIVDLALKKGWKIWNEEIKAASAA